MHFFLLASPAATCANIFTTIENIFYFQSQFASSGHGIIEHHFADRLSSAPITFANNNALRRHASRIFFCQRSKPLIKLRERPVARRENKLSAKLPPNSSICMENPSTRIIHIITCSDACVSLTLPQCQKIAMNNVGKDLGHFVSTVFWYQQKCYVL